MTSFTPIVLDGANLGQRHRYFNSLVTQACQQNALPSAPPPQAPLDRLFTIELASQRRDLDSTLQTLKDEDMLYVSRALKGTWLLDPEFCHVINPHYLEEHLYPEMITTAVNKMKHWIHLNLRDTKRCEEFFEYYSKNEGDLAMKFLSHCSREFILIKATDVLDKLTPHYLKLLSEKCPEVAKIFFESFHDNEKVLSNYLEQDLKYYNNLRFILKVYADIFLDITEKYFYNSSYKRFSQEATKYVMNNCKERFRNKPELYTAWLLDVKTLAKCLNENEIKDVVLKLARAKYLSGWFNYKNVEPLIQRLPVEERADFKKLVFVDKSIGDKVQDWPYKPPSKPSVKFSKSDIFQDKQHYPRKYTETDCGMMNLRAMCMKRKYCAFTQSCDMKCQKQTALDQLFDRYRFVSFEKVLIELSKKMTVESLQNRQNMMLVLVSKTGGRSKSVEELLNLLMEHHNNEPVHLRATIVRSLVKRSNAWRLPQEIWDLIMQFGQDLGLDGKPAAAPCIEGLHAILLRNMLLDRHTNPAVWNAFLKDFSNFKEYSLNAEEQRVVSSKLPIMLLNYAKSNPGQAFERLNNLLDTLDAYQIPSDKCPGVISAIATTVSQDSDARPLLYRLFNAGVARKELFKENFTIIQSDASYFNALNHDSEILKSGKEFESLIKVGNYRLERFLRAVTLYFGEQNGLAEKYISILEHEVDVSPKKNLARPIALLAGDKLLPLIQKMDSFPKNSPPRLLSAALRANLHLSRPLIDLETIGWQRIGSKAIANHVVICSTLKAGGIITKLLSSKRTYKLALLLSNRTKTEFNAFETVASEQSKVALKTALRYARYENKLDPRVWDIIMPLISRLDFSGENNVRLRKTLGNVSVVIPNRKAEYCATLYQAFKKISNIVALPILCKLEHILSEVEEQLIETIVKDFLENEFTEKCLIKRKFEDVEITRLCVRCIAKFLLLCKSDTIQKERLETVGKPFFDQMEALWSKYGNDSLPDYLESVKSDLTTYLDYFMSALKYTNVFLDPQYVSCLPVFDSVSSMIRKCIPIELHFKKYAYLHLTILYFKAIRQGIKNNPEIFRDLLPKTLNDRVELVGVLFGKYIARELTELKAKYFDSAFDLYKDAFMEYINEYFVHDATSKLFMASIIKGILESEGNSGLLAEYAYSRQFYQFTDCGGDEIFERLKKSDVPEMTSFTPIVLEGANLGQRHRYFNSLVTQARQQNALPSAPPPQAPLDRLFTIELASQRRDLDSTLQTLKDEDMLYVSRALKGIWLLNPEFCHVINPHYLEEHLYPEMITTAVNKMKHWIHLNLRDTKRCEEFFEYYNKKEGDLAMKFLSHCSREFILSKVTNVLDKLTPHYLKLLSEKCPEVAKIFFESFKNNKTILSTYLGNERHYYNNLRCILKLNSDVFLDITEKYFNTYEFKTLSPEATKYVMRHCRIRFHRKPELYTAWLLDMKTLAKCLSRDEAKDIVLKLAKAEYLSRWFSYKNVEPLIKTLPAKERAAFKNQVFIVKDIKDKVEEWPYEPPSRPEEYASGMDIFQDKNHSPREYENLDNLLKKRLIKKRCCKKKCDYTIITTSHQKSTLDLLFDRYRFASFEKTLFELRKKMTIEDQENRQNMMLVLVSKTGGRPECVEKLLKLLIERHENEPVNLRATVVRSLVKRSSSWRLPKDTWELMIQFGRDMGLDGKPVAVPCVEGLHAVVLRNMLLDRDCDSTVWDAFLGAFTNFLEYSISPAERSLILHKLPALLLSNAEDNPSQAIERLRQLLDTLDAYKITADKCPGVIALISATVRRNSNAKSLLQRLFIARICRKEFFKENFAIIQTDASYFNALKHDAAILESGKEFENLIESDHLHHKRFLRALTLYFGEENGLAEKYLTVVEKYADVSPTKRLASPLALLGGQKLISLLLKLDESNKNMAKKQLSAAIRANIHLARPFLDIDAFKWKYIGAKAVGNRVLRCSDVNVKNFIAKLLAWKHTHRLALVLSIRIRQEYDVLTTLVEQRHQFVLKTALWHTRRGNRLDLRVWDIIIPLIRKLEASKLNKRLREALDKVHVVPSERKPEYCASLFEVLKKITKNAAMPMLCHIECILPEADEKFIQNVINDFIDNEFTEENVTKGPNLKIVATASAGYNHCNVDELRARGIKLSNTPDVLSPAVAEIVIGLMLGAARRFTENLDQVHRGVWEIGFQTVLGQDVRGSTVGIIGLGGIGQAVVKRLAGFEVAKFLYTGHKEKPEGQALGADFVSLDDLLAQSDFVVLAVPLNNETRHMINKTSIAKMKKNSILVNVGRGDLVDQDALYDALKNKDIYAAGLDVTTPEPLPKDHKLLTLPNLFVLPHIGSATVRTRSDMATLAANNVVNALNGKPLITPVLP